MSDESVQPSGSVRSDGEAPTEGRVTGIPFTQYLLPNGRRVPVWIDRPPEIEAAAMRLIGTGARFTAEMLNTGEISFTCERGDDDEPDVLAHEICANGPVVPETVDSLVRAAMLSIAPEPSTPPLDLPPTPVVPLSSQEEPHDGQ